MNNKNPTARHTQGTKRWGAVAKRKVGNRMWPDHADYAYITTSPVTKIKGRLGGLPITKGSEFKEKINNKRLVTTNVF